MCICISSAQSPSFQPQTRTETKRHLNLGKSSTPNYPGGVCVVLSVDFSGSWGKPFRVPPAAALAAVSFTVSSGKEHSLSSNPASYLPPESPSSKSKDPRRVPAGVIRFLCPSSHIREKHNWNPLQKWRGL